MSSSECTQYNLQPPILERQLTLNKWVKAIYLLQSKKYPQKLVVEIKYDNSNNPTGYNIIHSIKSDDRGQLYISTYTVPCID